MVVALLVWWREEEAAAVMMMMKGRVSREWRPATRCHQTGLWLAVIRADLGCWLLLVLLTVATRRPGRRMPVIAIALLDEASEYQNGYLVPVLSPGVDSMSLCSLEADARFVW